MTRGTYTPFPVAPKGYNQAYMNRVVQTFSALLTQLQSPGALRGTTLTLTRLPDYNIAAAAGTVYNDGGILKISDGSRGALTLSAGQVSVATANGGEDTVVEFTWV